MTRARGTDRCSTNRPRGTPAPGYGCASTEPAPVRGRSCLLRTDSCGNWTNKALVHLLRGHLDVMRALVERFWAVEDPYVVQRVVAIAYGALLRSSPQQADQAKSLAELIHNLVFTPPVHPDELLLDAACGVVRWAVAQQLLPASVLDTSRRPYGLAVPGPPPTEATIKAKYGGREGQSADESYLSIYLSLMGMGDFARDGVPSDGVGDQLSVVFGVLGSSRVVWSACSSA